MEEKNRIMLDGEEIILPANATLEEMDDCVLLDENAPTGDLEELLDDTTEIDWSKDE